MSCFIDWFQKGLAQLWDGAQAAIQGVINNIAGIISAIQSNVSNVAQQFTNSFVSAFQMASNTISSVIDTFKSIPAAIMGALQGLGAMIMQGLGQLASYILGALQWVWSRFTQFMSSVYESLKGGIMFLWGMFSDTFKNLLDFTSGPFSFITEKLINPTISSLKDIHEYIQQNVIEVVIHNLPQTLVAFTVGEILSKLPMIAARLGEVNTFKMMILAPLGAMVMGHIMQGMLAPGGPLNITYTDSRRISGTLRYNKPPVHRSVRLHTSVYLLKESMEPVQSVGKARISYVHAVRLSADYDVDINVSMSIARGQEIQRTYTITPAPVVVSLQATQRITREYNISAGSVQTSLVPSVRITREYNISAQAPQMSLLSAPVVYREYNISARAPTIEVYPPRIEQVTTTALEVGLNISIGIVSHRRRRFDSDTTQSTAFVS